ncbi:MAG TPA: Uma2 family endonuclease [Thermoanaerobaculia bacterium]|nr:Uma2 family endonuclease [Thermoanaerobaculia bacterium]
MGAHATLQDVLNVPEHLTAELLDGELLLSRRGSPRQSRMRTVLDITLHNLPGWFILRKPELHVGANLFVPEFGGWRGECWLDDEQAEDVSPDWVCDIVTIWPDAFDPRIKLPTYADHGVAHAWIIDLPNNNVEVKRLEKGDWIDIALFKTNEPFHAEPFPDIEIDFGSIWPSPPAS